MVIPSYGNDLNSWQREKERVAKTTPKCWRNILLGIYDNTPHERLFTTPSQFVDDIAWRVYIEACLNPEEKFDPDNYRGEALMGFVGREIYFASERASRKGLLEQPPLNKNSDEKIFSKVLEGVVKRAIELYSDWNGITQPPKGSDDKRNLRDNLEPYVGF
jgi:hypothetical protein